MSTEKVNDTAPETREELLSRAARYAETVDVEVDLSAVDWEISERATRRAGACLYDEDADEVIIRLTWDAYREFGWSEFAQTVRHELVHAWEFQEFGRSGHGERFRRKAEEVNASRHCRSFTDPRLRLVCTNDDCDWVATRHRAAKTVTYPSKRRCGVCHSRYLVEHVESGEAWGDNAGYEAARERIDDW